MLTNFKIIRRRYRYLLLAFPILLFFIIFFFYPVWRMAEISFYKPLPYADYAKTFTLQNYINFLTDTFYLKVLGRSFLLGIVVTLVTIPLGFLIAYSLWVSEGLKRKALYFCILLPLFTNLVIRLYGWRIILSPTGPINIIIKQMGIIDTPLRLLFTFPAVVLGLFTECAPYYILIVFSVLTQIKWRYVEVARDLGASQLKTTFKVIIPLSLPGIISGGFLTFIWSFGAFATPMIIGSPSEWTAAVHAERQILSIRDWPFGAAIGFTLLGLVIVLLYLQTRLSPRIRISQVE